MGTEISRNLDEKSCASSWEFVQRGSSGPGSSKSPSLGGSCRGAAESSTRCKDKVPQHSPVNGSARSFTFGSEASCDNSCEDATAEGISDSHSTANWYPQDSMEIDAVLAQELGLLAGTEDLRSHAGACEQARAAPCNTESRDAFKTGKVARPCLRDCSTPSVCEQAYSMLQFTGMQLIGVPQESPMCTDWPQDQSSACCTQAPSLKNFLDEDIPKFPFARSPRGAATWTRVTA